MKTLKQLISAAVIASQVLYAPVSFASDDSDSADSGPVLTDSGRSFTRGERVDVPEETGIGDEITDREGKSWKAVDTYTHEAEKILIFERTEPETAPSATNEPGHGRRLNDADQVVDAADERGLVEAKEMPDFAREFDADNYTKDLEDKMGTSEFDAWSSSVEQYLAGDSILANAIGTLAPYPRASIAPVSANFIQSIDRFMYKIVEKIAKLENNLMAFGISQASRADSDSAWQCSECGAIPESFEFSQEADSQGSLSGHVASGIDRLGNTNGQHEFTMPPGEQRDELLNIHNKLQGIQAQSPQGETARLIGLVATYEADDSATAGDQESFEQFKVIAVSMLDIAIGLSPVGGVKDLFEFVSGQGLIDGHKLSTTERTLAAFGAITFGVGSKAGLTTKFGKNLVDLAKRTKFGNATLDALAALAAKAHAAGERTTAGFREFTRTSRRKFIDETGAIGRDIRSVANMNEFFATEFGAKVKSASQKTSLRFHSQPVYRVKDNSVRPTLEPGQHFYLDGLHKDHLEVFDSRGRFKKVINLDGEINPSKTESARTQARRIDL